MEYCNKFHWKRILLVFFPFCFFLFCILVQCQIIAHLNKLLNPFTKHWVNKQAGNTLISFNRQFYCKKAWDHCDGEIQITTDPVHSSDLRAFGTCLPSSRSTAHWTDGLCDPGPPLELCWRWPPCQVFGISRPYAPSWPPRFRQGVVHLRPKK